jgi:hypothetical protein
VSIKHGDIEEAIMRHRSTGTGACRTRAACCDRGAFFRLHIDLLRVTSAMCCR